MASRRGRISVKRKQSRGVSQLPFAAVNNPYPAMEILTAGQIEKIVDGALTILETKGMRFLHDQSGRLLVAAGGKEDPAQQSIRFDREMVLEHLSWAPASFGLRARNSQHDLTIGGNNIVFTSVGGPAFCSDLDKGRRPGTYAELCDYLRLVQSLNIIHQEGGGAFEAMDLPPLSRHLDLYLAQFTLLDKNVQAYALGRDRTIDCIEMTCIALDTDRRELLDKPAVLGIINTNSPMQLDVPMSEAIIELAGAGQVSCVTPFTLAGSMSPVSLAGTLVQQTAEVLATVTLVQCVRPGAPVVYGSFASNVDMKSGAPAMGTPEFTKMALASSQIARYLGLPSRSSNTTSSNCVDAQSAYESEMSLWGSVMGHTNLVNHAAGWLEGGLTASFEKLILDAEMLQMMTQTLEPLAVTEDELALQTIVEVPPGGHHFATEHTLARYENAFYPSMLSSRQNFESWEELGAQDTVTRANQVWKTLLDEYQQPEMGVSTQAALNDYVSQRKKEIKQS